MLKGTAKKPFFSFSFSFYLLYHFRHLPQTALPYKSNAKDKQTNMDFDEYRQRGNAPSLFIWIFIHNTHTAYIQV